MHNTTYCQQCLTSPSHQAGTTTWLWRSCFPYSHTYRLCKPSKSYPQFHHSIPLHLFCTNIKKLQRVQTSVARVVLPNLSQQPATALLSELHWLPVNSGITFKLACLTYKLLTTGQPAYLRMLLHHYTTTRTLRSTNQFFVDTPRFSTDSGKRSFSYLAPTVRNGLPLNIRLLPTFDTFKRRLKTHLFK